MRQQQLDGKAQSFGKALSGAQVKKYREMKEEFMSIMRTIDGIIAQLDSRAGEVERKIRDNPSLATNCVRLREEAARLNGPSCKGEWEQLQEDSQGKLRLPAFNANRNKDAQRQAKDFLIGLDEIFMRASALLKVGHKILQQFNLPGEIDNTESRVRRHLERGGYILPDEDG